MTKQLRHKMSAKITARKSVKVSVIHVNGKAINLIDFTLTDSGFELFTESELDAYKAAYAYSSVQSYKGNDVKVQLSENLNRWFVTVSKA